jgi:hypothetical protein
MSDAPRIIRAASDIVTVSLIMDVRRSYFGKIRKKRQRHISGCSASARDRISLLRVQEYRHPVYSAIIFVLPPGRLARLAK